MRNTPLPLKLVINFVAYIGYTLIISIIFSFCFPLILKLFGKEVYNPADPIFTKIQITIAVIVFVITLIFRKNFYISLSKEDYIKDDFIIEKNKKVEEKKEIETDWLNFDSNIKETTMEKPLKKENKYSFKMDDLNEEDDDNDLKIFIDKEIKR